MLHLVLKFVTFFQDRLRLIFGCEVVVGFNGCFDFGQCTIQFAGFRLEFIRDFPRRTAGRFLSPFDELAYFVDRLLRLFPLLQRGRLRIFFPPLSLGDDPLCVSLGFPPVNYWRGCSLGEILRA